jgi:uncharacterized protein (TIGR00266 family)
MTDRLDFEITHRPDFAWLKVRLAQGQQVFGEPSAMATKDPGVELKAGLLGGFGRSLGRAFGGESLIINTFTAKGGPGEITFAPGPAGDLVHHRLAGGRLLLQRGAFVAHGGGVSITGSWQGAKGFFSGEGLVLLQASGEGDLFFNSYGGIIELDVADEYIVDTGYIVAFEDTLSYRVSVLSGLRARSQLKSLLFGGEGLVCRFTGRGKLWIQTRTIAPFLRWVHPFRPAKSNG